MADDDDFPIDLDHVKCDFPLWTIARSSVHEKHGLPAGIWVIQGTDRRTLLPLFTDEDLARSMIEHDSLTDAIAVPIGSKALLRRILVLYEEHGGEHVGFDICVIAGRPRGGTVSAARLLADVRADPS